MLSPFLQPSERRAPRRLGHEGLQQWSEGEREALTALREEQMASALTQATQKPSVNDLEKGCARGPSTLAFIYLVL